MLYGRWKLGGGRDPARAPLLTDGLGRPFSFGSELGPFKPLAPQMRRCGKVVKDPQAGVGKTMSWLIAPQSSRVWSNNFINRRTPFPVTLRIQNAGHGDSHQH